MTTLAAGGGTAFRIFVAAVAVCGAGGCVWTFFAGRKGIAIHRIYPVAALIFGSIYLILIPTYSTPDEQDHFKSAYWYADYGQTHELRDAPWVMGMRKGDLIYDGYLDEKSDYDDFIATFSYNSKEDIEEWDYAYFVSFGNRFSYLLPSLGMRIAMSLGLSFGWLCMFATIPNMLLFILMTTYAMYRLPYGKRALFVIALLPITLQQASSISYDCPLIAASILVTSLAIHWMADGMPLTIAKIREEGVCRNLPDLCDIAMLFLAIFILINCKHGAYLPLLLLIPLLCHDRLPMLRTKKRAAITGVVLLAVIALAMAAGGWARVTEFMTTMPYRDHLSDYGYSPADYLHNPAYLTGVLLNTLKTDGKTWIYELFGGNLCWRNINVSGDLIRLEILLFVISLVGCSADAGDRERMTVGRRIGTMLIALIPCAISVAAMLIYWTEKNATLIDGVQGRYFLPCLTAMGLAFGYWKKPLFKFNTDRAVCTAAAVLSYLVMLDVLLIV